MTVLLPWPLSRLLPSEQSISAVVTPSNAVEHVRGSAGSISSLLRYYEQPGVRPPSSRVPPSEQQTALGFTGFTVGHVFRFGALVASKTTEVSLAVLSHHIWGPRRKSWGVHMTILSSLMHNVGQHSSLVDIATIRMLISLGGLIPLPPDALVTPVTFRVRKRNLRGILAACDTLEDSSRELSCEWIVNKRLWQRLQGEWKAMHSPHAEDEPPPVREHHKDRVILYLHGGAYYMFSPATHRGITVPLSRFADARVFAVDYRLAPETRFPGPLHDAVSAYFRLIDDLHIPPENITVAGDSAGGGLALALLMYLRDNHYLLPSGGILMSPWVDLTRSCDSWESNEPYDVISFPPSGDHLDPVTCYLGPHMERYLTHPYASPLFGDFRGLPPLLIQAGDAEVLRDEITLLAHKATLAGVDVQHELFEDAIHVFQAFPALFGDAAHRALASCRAFVRDRRAGSPRALDSAAEDELELETDNAKTRAFRGDGLPFAPASPDWPASAEDGDDEPGQDTGAEDSDTGVTVPLPRWRPRAGKTMVMGAPQPVTRARSSSHPDIASLCRHWADSGPANATTTVAAPRVRARHARSVSFVVE